MTQRSVLLGGDASIRDLLASEGYDVDVAPSPDAIPDRIAESTVDCAVIEVRPSAENGFGAVEAVRDRDPIVPVVAVGTPSLSTAATDALAAGAAAYVSREDEGFAESLAAAVDDATETARRRRDRTRLSREAPVPGCVLRDGVIRFAAPRIGDLLGVGAVVDRPLLELVDEPDRSAVRAALEDAGEEPGSVRFAPVGDAGRTVEAWYRRTDDGAVVAALLDVTDQVDRLTELRRQNQRLTEFTEVLTHDLRNPLNVADGYLELIREDPSPEAFEQCADALRRIDGLIEEVRSAVLENTVHPEPVALAAAARDAWSTVDTGGAELEVDGDLRLRADPARLRRLLENLFRNAVEHGSTSPRSSSTHEDAVEHGSTGRADADASPDAVEHGSTGHADADAPGDAAEHGAVGGSGASAAADGSTGAVPEQEPLTVRVVALDDGFAVEDDGAGLPADLEGELFERGFTTTREGTGIGLAIVRNVAETHGWEVAAGESEAGGARFVFSEVLRSGESVVEMTACGEDIWNDSDQGHFYYDRVTGDFDVSVEVRSVEHTHAWAKGGLMIRAGTDPAAPHVMLRRRPSGATTVQWRPEPGADARSLTSLAGRPHAEQDDVEPHHDWLRLVRDGDAIRAYTSETGADGDWALLAELDRSAVELPQRALVGLAATSHNRVEPTRVRFAGLEGVDPGTNADIGDPIASGEVRSIEPALVTATDPAAVAPESATLRGAVESMQARDRLDVRFEYRRVVGDDWTTVGGDRLSEPGAVSADVGDLTPRRYYEYRVVADYGDDCERSDPVVFATPSRSSGAERAGPDSSARFDPGDGFAEVAPWLDDDTPVVVITEPDREQLETAATIDGPRVIAFETSGTIDLAGQDVAITGDRCWLAGQTAPSPGITLARGRLEVSADDCVIQHVRSRPGDAGRDADAGFDPEGILVDDETENVVVDHCTATWSPVENATVSYRTARVTVSNCLIAEGLYDTTCARGRRGFGSLVGDGATDVALLGNIWAHNRGRNPWLQIDTETVLVNNVLYDFGEGIALDESAAAVIEGNAFLRGDDEVPIAGGRASLADNRADHAGPTAENVDLLSDRPLWPDELDPLPGDRALEHALTHAGARPADRTAHDERIVEQVRSGTGEWIDSQGDVGGYPELPENRRELSIPDEGLRAWLRERARDVEP